MSEEGGVGVDSFSKKEELIQQEDVFSRKMDPWELYSS